MRQTTRIFTLCALGLAVGVGCTPPTNDGDIDAYRDVLPDDRVQISMNADYGGARDLGEMAEGYLVTAQVTNDVNGLIGGVLSIVDAVTDYEPSWSAEEEATAVWGPFSDALDPAETVLVVHHDEVQDLYTWTIAQRLKGSTDWDDFDSLVIGQVEGDATEDDSEGWFYLDFDVASQYDPTSDTTGLFASAYDIDPDGVSATAAFEDFMPEGEEGPINAFYAYEQQNGAGGSMDLVFEGDIDDDPTSLAETHAIRTRWNEDGSGRTDSGVGGGDYGEDTVLGYQSECWDPAPDFGRTFHAASWDLSSIEGDPSSCVFSDEDFSDEAGE